MSRRLPGRTRMDEVLGMAEPRRRRLRPEERSMPRLVCDGHVERVPSVAIEHTPGGRAAECAALVGLVTRVDALVETEFEGFERVALLLDGRLKAAVSWTVAADRPDSFIRSVADALARAVEAEGKFGGVRLPRLREAGVSDPIGQSSQDEPADSDDVEGPVEAPMGDIGKDGGE